MNGSRKHVLVLSSGGVDSTGCIQFFKKLKFEVEAIFFDYGQPAKKYELKAITALSEYYNIPLHTIKVKSDKSFFDGLVLGRNAAFYFFALMHFTKKSGIIASGIHAGTSYYDCSKSFFKNIERVYDGYTNGTIKPAAPFLNFSKKDIWDFCIKEKVPLSFTYSCERGLGKACGKCSTCKDFIQIYENSD
jgi:7-cyano-7-deazaguanine synthase